MTERWVTIKGHEEYEVSDLGRVRKVATGYVLQAKPNPSSGYVKVGLYKRGDDVRTMNMHNLVANAFLPPEEGKTQVDHIDGDRANNALANLERVTPKENRRRASVRGTSSAITNPSFRFKLTGDDVVKIRERLAAKDPVNAIARDYRVKWGTIARIRDGRSWRNPNRPSPTPAQIYEQCAQIAESFATCPCNGEHGRCTENDGPRAIAAAIREQATAAVIADTACTATVRSLEP